jgi:hypothetical protein
MSNAKPAANATTNDLPLLPWEKSGSGPSLDEITAALDEELPEQDTSAEDEPVPAEAGDEDEPIEESDDDLDELEDDESAEEDEEEPESRFKVKADGEEIEVTLDELLKGYSRTADYTRKTQQVAQERKALEQHATEMRTARDSYAQQLQLLESALTELAPAEPDWDTLRRENPTEYAVQLAEHQQRRHDMDRVRSEQQRLYAQQAAEYEAGLERRFAQEERLLLAAVPEWTDEKAASAEKRAILDYARGAGYTDEELSQVYDHRVILLFRKAMQHDKLMTQGVQKIREKAAAAPKKAPPLRPGSAPPPKPKNLKGAEAAKRAMGRLGRTGSVNDAAAALAFMLDD